MQELMTVKTNNRMYDHETFNLYQTGSRFQYWSVQEIKERDLIQILQI